MSRLTELQDLTAQYSELMYPGMEVLDGLTGRECEQRDQEARRLAVRIADLVIETGVHRGEALR